MKKVLCGLLITLGFLAGSSAMAEVYTVHIKNYNKVPIKPGQYGLQCIYCGSVYTSVSKDGTYSFSSTLSTCNDHRLWCTGIQPGKVVICGQTQLPPNNTIDMGTCKINK